MVCVHDFPRGKVSVKVGVMEFGLNLAATSSSLLLRYWTLGYGKTAMSRYEHFVA